MVKIFSSIMAAIGRQLKQSVKVFQSLMLYRRLPKYNSRQGYETRPDSKRRRDLWTMDER